MPYFLIDGESIYAKLHQPKFHWLVFSAAPSGGQAVKADLESQYCEFVECDTVSLNPHVGEVFGSNKSFQVLLRPDNHIGFLCTESSVDRLGVYLNEIIGHS